MTVKPIFFHVDLDAFFASVEQFDNPDYRGKPVIVGGDASSRGVVSTCSYEARRYGVHSAMPMARAVALCPQAIFLHGRMHRYSEKSREVMRILSDFSPSVQQISIDEAFLDMSGTERLFGKPEDVAKKLKKRVQDETGLTVSVGVAANRYIAKISSGLSKPDGLVIVSSGEEESFMKKLRLKDVWGVGEKTRTRLEESGLSTVTAIHDCSESLLRGILGEAGGSFLYTVVRGIDPGICTSASASRSISSEYTFPTDLTDIETMETTILDLSSDLMYRLLDEGYSSRTVHIKIRYGDFTTVSIQETSDRNILDTGDLFSRAKNLFNKKYNRFQPIRLIGIGIYNLTEKPIPEQIDLFADKPSGNQRKVEEAIHALTKKRGKKMVTRARLIEGHGGEKD